MLERKGAKKKTRGKAKRAAEAAEEAEKLAAEKAAAEKAKREAEAAANRGEAEGTPTSTPGEMPTSPVPNTPKSRFKKTLDKISAEPEQKTFTKGTGEASKVQADKEDSERISRAAARGTARKKMSFRTVTEPDGSETVQTIRQGLTTRPDGKLMPRFNRAAFTRTGPEDTKFKARMRGLAGTMPARSVRAAGERAVDKGFLKTGVTRSVSKFQQGRRSMNQPRKTTYSEAIEYQKIGAILAEASAAWTRKAGKNPSGGLNAKGVASYRAKNPGSKLKTAVTTKPSKLKKGSKAAKRRSSFCSRMSGMRKRQNPKNNTGKDRLSLSLKKWNC